MPTILLTGGTGYIGSHTCVELIGAGFDTILFDNLCNSSPIVVNRIEQITGTRPTFIEGDIRDSTALDGLFRMYSVDVVIHFAGLKAVGESVEKPLEYYINNVCGSCTLFDAMLAHGVRRIAFSSSATVYDPNAAMPLKETSPVRPANPYGRSKLMIEQVLRDMSNRDRHWRPISLRYFNPVGAHESGLIGEDPRDTPNNLMPYIARVAVGRLPKLRVFGDDYPTEDGTGVRDYIHVVDLSMAHLAAVRRLLRKEPLEYDVVNIGTGRGHSVYELLRAFTGASGRPIAHEVAGRRAGDVAVSYADARLSEAFLQWQPSRGIDAMCADAWRWQSKNPNGFV
jgi:UDP-glucose 4-epimerase